jgi:hypothetical protein
VREGSASTAHGRRNRTRDRGPELSLSLCSPRSAGMSERLALRDVSIYGGDKRTLAESLAFIQETASTIVPGGTADPSELQVKLRPDTTVHRARAEKSLRLPTSTTVSKPSVDDQRPRFCFGPYQHTFRCAPHINRDQQSIGHGAGSGLRLFSERFVMELALISGRRIANRKDINAPWGTAEL